jgi:hypothetical protein
MSATNPSTSPEAAAKPSASPASKRKRQRQRDRDHTLRDDDTRPPKRLHLDLDDGGDDRQEEREGDTAAARRHPPPHHHHHHQRRRTSGRAGDGDEGSDSGSGSDSGVVALPHELVACVMRHLPPLFRVAGRLVCRAWRDALPVDTSRPRRLSPLRPACTPADWFVGMLARVPAREMHRHVRYLLWLADTHLRLADRPPGASQARHIAAGLLRAVAHADPPAGGRRLYAELHRRGVFPFAMSRCCHGAMFSVFRLGGGWLVGEAIAFPVDDSFDADFYRVCVAQLVRRAGPEAVPILRGLTQWSGSGLLVETVALNAALAAPDCESADGVSPLSAFHWLRMCGAPWDESTATEAARRGRIRVLRAMVEFGLRPCWENVACAAARSGHADVLEWVHLVHDFGAASPPAKAVVGAAKHTGDARLVGWMLDRGYPLDADLAAASVGHPDLLRFLIEDRGCPFDRRVVEALACRMWLGPHAPWARAAIERLVARAGSAGLADSHLAALAVRHSPDPEADLRWAQGLGAPFGQECILEALELPEAAERTACLRFLVERVGLRPTEGHLLRCLRDDAPDALEYFFAALPGLRMPEGATREAARAGNVDALKRLASAGREDVLSAKTLAAAAGARWRGHRAVAWLTAEGGVEVGVDHLLGDVSNLRSMRTLLRRFRGEEVARTEGGLKTTWSARAWLKRWCDNVGGVDECTAFENVLEWALRKGICSRCIEWGRRVGLHCRCDVCH